MDYEFYVLRHFESLVEIIEDYHSGLLTMIEPDTDRYLYALESLRELASLGLQDAMDFLEESDLMYDV